jgi:hypothetical protein
LLNRRDGKLPRCYAGRMEADVSNATPIGLTANSLEESSFRLLSAVAIVFDGLLVAICRRGLQSTATILIMTGQTRGCNGQCRRRPSGFSIPRPAARRLQEAGRCCHISHGIPELDGLARAQASREIAELQTFVRADVREVSNISTLPVIFSSRSVVTLPYYSSSELAADRANALAASICASSARRW